jgi:hypothetical protein
MRESSAKFLRAQYDLPNWGAVCYRIRESRPGVTAKDIADLVGAKRAQISSTLEKRGSIGPEVFKRYIEALQNIRFFNPPISKEEVRMLQLFYETHDKRTQRRLQLELADTSFRKIISRDRPDDLTRLYNKLRDTTLPGFIGDNLRFVHAVNGELLTLYNIDPYSDFLNRWEAWHDLAIKFLLNSPVRKAHPYPEHFLSYSVTNFVRDAVVHRYLFTYQMRELIRSLMDLSTDNEFDFYRYWNEAICCLTPPIRSTARAIDYGEKRIQTKIRVEERIAVQVGRRHFADFSLFLWEPETNEEKKAFADITSRARREHRDRVFFAADFDKKRNFHVNTWPSVREHIENSDLI